MPAMRHAPGARTSRTSCSTIQRAQILDQPVGQRAVELQPVAIRSHPAMTQQVAGILMREEVFAGRHRRS